MTIYDPSFHEDINNVEFVIYCRKSTEEEDKQVQSIADQIRYCIDYAEKNNLKLMPKPDYAEDFQSIREQAMEDRDIDKETYKYCEKYFIVRERFSAKTPFKRKKWTKLVELVKKWKVKWLISYSPDRQARNLVEWWELVDLAEWKFVALKYTNFHFTNNASGRMMLGIWFVLSKQYSDNLSESVRRWNYSAVDKKESLWYKKYWYLIDSKSHYKPHPKHFKHVKHAFHMKLYEEATDGEIATYLCNNDVHKLTEDKTKIYPDDKAVWRLLSLSLYYGVMAYWWAEISLIWMGEYKPMITPEEWQKLKEMSRKWKNTITKWADSENLEYYPFENGAITAPDGSTLSCSLPNPLRYARKLEKEKIKNPDATIWDVVLPHQIMFDVRSKKSIYYKKLKPINFSVIEDHVVNYLKWLRVNPEAYQEYLDYMENDFEETLDENEIRKVELTREIWITTRELNELRTWYIKKTDIDDEEKKLYENMKNDLNSKIIYLKSEREKIDDEERSKIIEIEAMKELFSNAYLYYKKTTYVQKRLFAKMIDLNIKITPQNKLKIEPSEVFKKFFF